MTIVPSEIRKLNFKSQEWTIVICWIKNGSLLNQEWSMDHSWLHVTVTWSGFVSLDCFLTVGVVFIFHGISSIALWETEVYRLFISRASRSVCVAGNVAWIMSNFTRSRSLCWAMSGRSMTDNRLWVWTVKAKSEVSLFKFWIFLSSRSSLACFKGNGIWL